jgi:N-acetylmuramoyl-L-alanine amidase
MRNFILFLTTTITNLLPTQSIKTANFNVFLTDGKDKKTFYAAPTAPEYRLKKVVIDAGHGGHDAGCSGTFMVGKTKDKKSVIHYEKNNTLKMALQLGTKIKKKFPEIEVVYTRTKDVFVELDERADIANKAKADLFISIHCNSTDGNPVHGTETYTLGLHKKEANLRVAKRENASILLEKNYKQKYAGFDPLSTEAYIIFNLIQNNYLEHSVRFAQLVENQMETIDRTSLGVKQAGFMVLKATAMPSVLIETGFLNHHTEGLYISDEKGQEKLTDAILTAFQKYKKEVEIIPVVEKKETEPKPKKIKKNSN